MKGSGEEEARAGGGEREGKWHDGPDIAITTSQAALYYLPP